MFITVGAGEELIETVTKFFEHASADLREAGLLLIGAVDDAVLSTMDIHRNDEHVHYQEPMELTGTGEVLGQGEVHIHATLGRRGNVSVTGHLHRAVVTSFFVRVWVIPPWWWEE